MRQLLPSFALSALLLAGCQGDPATPEYWGKQLDNAQKPKDRVKVVEDLRGSGKVTASFLPLLHKKLESEKSAEVKAALVKLVAAQKDPSSLDALVGAVDLANPEPAAHALNKDIAAALAASGDKKAVPTLRKLLKSRDPYVRIQAIEGLGALKSPDVVPELSDIATSELEENFISKKAIIALGNIGDGSAIPALTKMMFRERKGVSFYAESSFSLFQVGPKSGDAMLTILDGKDADLLAYAREKGLKEAALIAKAAMLEGDLRDARAEKQLLGLLKYDNTMLDLKLIVRMQAAEALGRLRSKEAVKPLSLLLEEEEANARGYYVRALTKIGSADAVPALLKCAAKGPWDAREPCIQGVAALGGEKAIAELQKLAKAEAAATAAECKDNPDYMGCKDVPALVKKHEEVLATAQKSLAAAKDCNADAACWTGKLADGEPTVRARAALELGRSGKADAATALMKQLSDKNLDARLAFIQALDWLSDDAAASAEAKKLLPELEKQLESERGKTEFVKVNEDLRRLAVKLRRT